MRPLLGPIIATYSSYLQRTHQGVAQASRLPTTAIGRAPLLHRVGSRILLVPKKLDSPTRYVFYIVAEPGKWVRSDALKARQFLFRAVRDRGGILRLSHAPEMTSFPTTFDRVMGFFFVYLVFLAVYAVVTRLYLSPLAKVPGPKLAALSYLYEWYYDIIQQGRFPFKVRSLHEQYGMCIAPSKKEALAKNKK